MIKGARRKLTDVWFCLVYQFWGPGDSEAVEGLKDGVLSGGF